MVLEPMIEMFTLLEFPDQYMLMENVQKLPKSRPYYPGDNQKAQYYDEA